LEDLHIFWAAKKKGYTLSHTMHTVTAGVQAEAMCAIWHTMYTRKYLYLARMGFVYILCNKHTLNTALSQQFEINLDPQYFIKYMKGPN
jgi:hypothetical protein